MSDDPVALARWLHYRYEEFAAEEGWRTQRDCQVEWEALPERNRRVMLRLAEALQAARRAEEGAELAALRAEHQRCDFRLQEETEGRMESVRLRGETLTELAAALESRDQAKKELRALREVAEAIFGGMENWEDHASLPEEYTPILNRRLTRLAVALRGGASGDSGQPSPGGEKVEGGSSKPEAPGGRRAGGRGR